MVMNTPFYFFKKIEFGYTHIVLWLYFFKKNVLEYNLPHHMELVLYKINNSRKLIFFTNQDILMYNFYKKNMRMKHHINLG